MKAPPRPSYSPFEISVEELKAWRMELLQTDKPVWSVIHSINDYLDSIDAWEAWERDRDAQAEAKGDDARSDAADIH